MDLTAEAFTFFPAKHKEVRVAFVEKHSSSSQLTAEINKQIKLREDEGLQVLSIRTLDKENKVFILFGRGASHV